MKAERTISWYISPCANYELHCITLELSRKSRNPMVGVYLFMSSQTTVALLLLQFGSKASHSVASSSDSIHWFIQEILCKALIERPSSMIVYTLLMLPDMCSEGHIILRTLWETIISYDVLHCKLTQDMPSGYFPIQITLSSACHSQTSQNV